MNDIREAVSGAIQALRQDRGAPGDGEHGAQTAAGTLWPVVYRVSRWLAWPLQLHTDGFVSVLRLGGSGATTSGAQTAECGRVGVPMFLSDPFMSVGCLKMGLRPRGEVRRRQVSVAER